MDKTMMNPTPITDEAALPHMSALSSPAPEATLSEKIKEGMEEALAVARGEAEPYAVHHVPTSDTAEELELEVVAWCYTEHYTDRPSQSTVLPYEPADLPYPGRSETEPLVRQSDALTIIEEQARTIEKLRAENERLQIYAVWDFPKDIQDLTVKLETTEAERDELRAALDSSPDGSGMWRFWADKASTLAESNGELRAEVERLRGEMKRIAEGNLGDEPWQTNYQRIQDVARAALAGGSDE